MSINLFGMIFSFFIPGLVLGVMAGVEIESARRERKRGGAK